MFNDKLLAIIFSNIEKIYHFHLDFLRSTERQCNQAWKDISSVGEIGAIFVQNVSGYYSKPGIYVIHSQPRIHATGGGATAQALVFELTGTCRLYAPNFIPILCPFFMHAHTSTADNN